MTDCLLPSTEQVAARKQNLSASISTVVDLKKNRLPTYYSFNVMAFSGFSHALFKHTDFGGVFTNIPPLQFRAVAATNS